MAAGAVSLKLPNFLTTSQDVTKGADQANYKTSVLRFWRFLKRFLIEAAANYRSTRYLA